MSKSRYPYTSEPPSTRWDEQHPSKYRVNPSRQQVSHRKRLLYSLLSVGVVVFIIAGVSLALFKSHAPSSSPQSTTPPAPSGPAYLPQPKDVLSSIYMASTTDGWTVGSRFVDKGVRDALILHFNGADWEQISGPNNHTLQASSSSLTQVVMVSAAEGWAVGNLSSVRAQAPQAFILHYTDGRWSLQETIPRVELSAIAMLSAGDGWVVGTTTYVAGVAQQGVLLHYTGKTWQQLPAPGTTLEHIVMPSPTDGWMVGTTQPSGPSLWHYDGSAWTPVSIAGMDRVSLLSMVTASDGWAVGVRTISNGSKNALSSQGGKTVFAHYDGQAWTSVQTSTQNIQVTSLSLDSSSDGWAVGAVTVPSNGGVALTDNLYLHYTGGQWAQVTGPAGDGGLAVFMLSASDGWAVSIDGAILRYQQNVWKIVVGPGSK
jgi:hypothetical protein